MHQAHINVDVGERIILQFSGEKGSMKSEVVGYSFDNYIIIRAPAIPGIRNKVLDGKDVIVKFFFDGIVYGFKSDVLNYVTKPESLLFINYPAYIEKVEIRSHSRILCNLPAAVYIKESNLEGIIFDISKGGCRLNIYNFNYSLVKNFAIEEEVRLNFYLPTDTEPLDIKSRAKNINSSSDNVSIGLQFSENDPSVQKISKYVDYVNRLSNRNQG